MSFRAINKSSNPDTHAMSNNAQESKPDDSHLEDASASPTTSRSSVRSRPAPRLRAGIQRKTKAERDEIARRQAEREQEREAAEANKEAVIVRGRGGVRGTRGTRGTTTLAGRGAPTVSGTGVFGSGTGYAPSKTKAVDVGFSEALDGGESAATTSAIVPVTNTEVIGSVKDRNGGVGGGGGGGGGGRGQSKKDEETVVYEQLDEEQPRRDIERIWISSDEDEDPVVTNRKGKQRLMSKTPKPKISLGLRPVRAARTILEEQDHDLTKKGRAVVKRRKGTDKDAIHEVSSDEMQLNDTPVVAMKQAPMSSPELSKKPLKRVDSRSQKDPRLLNETAEEKAERLRWDEDVEKMREEFVLSSKPEANNTNISSSLLDCSDRSGAEKFFLFQLPPLVPQLYDPSEPREMPADPAIDDASSTQIKTEPESTTKSGTSATDRPTVFTASSSHEQLPPSGFVGKLNIHKSGRVTLDWGGTDMEVRYGTEVDFLQDVIMVEPPKSTTEGLATETVPEGKIGKAYSIGQIKQKMVCIPDWSKLYA